MRRREAAAFNRPASDLREPKDLNKLLQLTASSEAATKGQRAQFDRRPATHMEAGEASNESDFELALKTPQRCDCIFVKMCTLRTSC